MRNIKTNKRIILLSVTTFAAILAAFILTETISRFSLKVVLNGEQVCLLEYGESWQDPGAVAVLSGEPVLAVEIPLPQVKINIIPSVPEKELGSFPVEYTAEYLFWQGRAERIIRVKDTKPPEIILETGPDFFFQPGVSYTEPGFRAVDNYDGDLTDKVVRTESEGVITYTVSDHSGNETTVCREVLAYDPNPPVISLIGEAEYPVPVGAVFQEPGYEAYDTVDGDLTQAVTVEGTVDTLYPGDYVLTYRVSDSYQHETAVTRVVKVTAQPWPEVQWPEGNTIYLTFDDGPGPYTQQLLKVLDKYDVKATFFVVDSEYAYLMKQIVAQGHSIGIHSVTHDYEKIYANPEAFFTDLREMQQIIFENTGVVTSLMRFPGGGSNLVSENYCEGIMSVLTQAVQDAGFRYFDWNVDSDDAGNARTAATVRNNVITGIQEAGIAMVLQHDIHGYSVAAVEQIIQWGLENGYRFSGIRDTTPGFHHDVLN